MRFVTGKVGFFLLLGAGGFFFLATHLSGSQGTAADRELLRAPAPVEAKTVPGSGPLREDLLEEVTRLCFERKRLQLEFQGSPTEDPILKRERALRIQELTAHLDGLTGGVFCEEWD